MATQITQGKNAGSLSILGYEVGDRPDVYCKDCWDWIAREGRTLAGTVKKLLYPQLKVKGILKKKSYICRTCGRRLYSL